MILKKHLTNQVEGGYNILNQSTKEEYIMNKCDFCREGPRRNPEQCGYRGYSCCEEAAKRYMQVVKSRNNHTHTYNKNVNVRKNTKKR